MGRERKKEREHAAPWRRKREEEDAEEEEELIFPLWEKHMLDLKSWRESSHLALIGIKRVVLVVVGGGEWGCGYGGRELPWLLLMIYCLKCERCFGESSSIQTLSALASENIISRGKAELRAGRLALKQPSQFGN